MKIDKVERRKLRRRYSLKQRNYNNVPRFSIFRSCKHLSVQIIDDSNNCTLVACSSLEKEFKAQGNKGYNLAGAAKIGEIIAKRAMAKNINNVIFDISSYKYHGKVKSIIETALSHGLNQVTEKKVLKEK